MAYRAIVNVLAKITCKKHSDKLNYHFMMTRYAHADPTFDAVAALEAKSCFGCKYKREIFGREICDNADNQNINLIRCSFYERIKIDREKTAGIA